MINICHFTSAHHPLDDRIFYKQCLSLSQEFNVYIIAPFDRDFTEQNIKIIHIKKFKRRAFRFLFTPILILIKILKIKPKVVHFHDPDLIPLGYLLKLLGYKVIYDAHEFYEKQILSKPYLTNFQKKFLSGLYLFMEKLSIWKFDFVIYPVNNELVQSKITNEKRKQKILVIHNFSDMDLFNKLPVKNKPNNKKPTSLIYVGGLTRQRGIKELIEVIKSIDNVQLILAGKWEDKSFEEECKSLPSFQKVTYLGLLNHTDIPKIINNADIGICLLHPTPNHQLALPIKVFEYFAAKKPVIANNFELWKKYFADACLYVDIHNNQEIINTINYLINNPEKQTELGEKGYQLILSKYNWKNESKKLIEAYKKITQ